MPDYDELPDARVGINTNNSTGQTTRKKTLLDYFSLIIATCGVGYLPIAPGTWGSFVGVLIYLGLRFQETNFLTSFNAKSWTEIQITAWIHIFNSLIFLLFCFLGIWASGRTAIILNTKDPQKVVVDEVIGQLIVFLFVPFGISWKLILAGFVLFRLFDIWKPYPINSLENLPSGLGVCADDILAGVYGGICLAAIYAVAISY